jgi:CO/xanthine dehydrogenase Mo-binding subunit
MKDPNEYIADFSVWGMIHAFTIRSPIAKGTLKEIIFPDLPDSFHLITAENIPGENSLADYPLPVLADKNLSYIGQPIAILAGPEKNKLEELLSQVEVITEKDKPVFSHFSEDIIVSRDIEYGDHSHAEDRQTVSGIYKTGIQEHWYAEPHGVVVVPSSLPVAGGKKEDAKTFTVYTATQWPFHVKRSVTRLLGLGSENIIVTPTLMTQHLDGKIWYPSLVACHAALASWITKCPVKLMLTREEDFMYSPKRNAAEIEIQSSLGDKGEICDLNVRVSLDLGAEGIFSNEIMDQTCLGTLGIYNHKAAKIKGFGLRTNIPPQGPLAGFGLAQGFFAAERHISRIADTLGQDPAEWRKNNFLKKNQSLPMGTVLKSSVPLPELIDKAASMSDYYRKWVSYELLKNKRRQEKWSVTEPLRGIGISTAFQGSGFLDNDEVNDACCTVEITLEKEGFLEIKTSLASSGTPHLRTWQNLAQEILGVDPALIRLTGNTGKAQDSGPGTLSRNIGITGNLVEKCCQAIRKLRFRDPLPITVSRSSRTAKKPGWVPDRTIDPDVFARPSWGAAVAEIEIDHVSLEPFIRGIWLVVDGGKILNEKQAVRTLKTGIIQALGWTCRENLRYEEGKIPLEYFKNYGIPSPGEIPAIMTSFIRTDTTISKGIGDLPFCCVPAAFIQAVSQAMNHDFENIPLTISEIWNAWKIKQREPD